MSNRNGRYLAALGGLIALFLATSSLAEGNKAQDQTPAAQADKGAAAQQNEARQAPAVVPPPKQQPAASQQTDKTEEKSVLGDIKRHLPWWLAMFLESELTNFLVMAFTGVLMVVAVMQNRLEHRLASEGAETLLIAKQSADAATKAATASERALTHVERAFIYPKAWAFTGWKNPLTGEFNGLGAALMWENSGNTPTKGMQSHFNYALRDTELPDDFNFPDVENFTPAVSLIGPKVVITIEQINLPPAELRQIQSGQMRFYVWGWAEYSDIFPDTQRHRTEFCHELVVPGDIDHPDGGTFIMRNYKRHNGSDGDCLNPLRTA